MAKENGFSRRHKTNEAHIERKENREAKLLAQLDHAHDRVAMSELRKPSIQLGRLDKRLGKGVGAIKERAKLKKRIASGDRSRATLAEEKAKKEDKKKN